MVKVKTLCHFEQRIGKELKIFDSGKEYLFDDAITDKLVRKGFVSNPEKIIEEITSPLFDSIEEEVIEEKMTDEKYENKMIEETQNNKSNKKGKKKSSKGKNS